MEQNYNDRAGKYHLWHADMTGICLVGLPFTFTRLVPQARPDLYERFTPFLYTFSLAVPATTKRNRVSKSASQENHNCCGAARVDARFTRPCCRVSPSTRRIAAV